jgi:hypothetical protein
MFGRKSKSQKAQEARAARDLAVVRSYLSDLAALIAEELDDEE